MLRLSLALASAALIWPIASQAQPIPRDIPGVRQLPQIPTPSRRGDASRRGDEAQSRSSRGSQGSDRDAYMRDVMLLAQGIDYSQNDDAAIDAEAAAYREAVERLAGDHYSGVPERMRQRSDQQALNHFRNLADNVDGQIEWATLRVSRNAGSNADMPKIAYNQMFALSLAMDAAVRLFPEDQTLAAAQSKTAAWMQRFGSRENAGNAFDAEVLAAARNVQMPPATRRDSSLEALFRTAWSTSGIDREIMLIHPRGGWGVKRDELGRVIGETHDAAIAARNTAAPDQCYLYDFTLLKLPTGNVRRSSHSTKRITCENVPAS